MTDAVQVREVLTQFYLNDCSVLNRLLSIVTRGEVIEPVRAETPMLRVNSAMKQDIAKWWSVIEGLSLHTGSARQNARLLF